MTKTMFNYKMSMIYWISSIWNKILKMLGSNKMLDDIRENSKKTDILLDFSYFSSFKKNIEYLASIIEEESWKPEHITIVPDDEEENNYYKKYDQFPILVCYLFNTFKRIRKENKLFVSDDEESACFHTGLFSPLREPVFALFQKNNHINKWYWKFKGFHLKNDRSILSLGTLPEMCDYSDCHLDLVFDPNKEIVSNIEHILYDHEYRYPIDFQKLSNIAKENLLDGAVNRAKYRVNQTPNMAVPQNHKGKIQLLLPLQLMADEPEVVLVLEIQNEFYRANTVFPLDWAYMNARVITKPTANWLKI